MKKKVIILSISFVLACFFACLIEKFMYPNEFFNFKQGLFEIASFFLVFTTSFVMINNKDNISIINFVKVTFSIGIVVFSSIFLQNVYYLVFGLIEIFIILLLTNVLVNKNKKLAYFFNSILFLMFNLQVALLILGGSFLRRIMLSNLESLEDLSGKSLLYISSAITVILISFLPLKKISINKKNNICFVTCFTLFEIIIVYVLSISYSPLGNYVILAKEEITYQKNLKAIKANAEELALIKDSFYKTEVKDFYNANHNLKNNPNIILIFTEGLSQNIVLDNRNIMPNIKEYEEKSINFTGYYNHTFATYRGLIGQLYSGYQYNNLDDNHLISIQKILQDNGYKTCYINSEPYNEEFTNYVNNFKFNEVITSDKTDGEIYTVSDKDLYELLFDTAINLNTGEEPFFLCTYSIGTHVSFDSPDEKFRDGKDNLLNRFYNVDYQFGKFIKEFENSSLYDNTIIVFTADHCTYSDLDFIRAFGNKYQRPITVLDDMPLFIYHKGIEHADIDVNGRNTLSLVPTILDYVDITGPNYFLGESLFSGKDNKNKFDHYFHDDITFCSTFDKTICTEIEEIDQDIINSINDYLSISSQ